MNSNDEFIKALAAITIAPAPTLEYRFHYNDSGEIYMCTMINHPENTQYLVVDKTMYDNYSHYKIENNKLKLIDNNNVYHVQLKSSNQGYAVVKDHAGILLENETYNDIEYYDNN